MPKALSRILLMLPATFMIASCTSTPEKISCAQRDWYENGRHDGAQGSTLDRLAKYKVECGQEFNGAFESLYTNGRNAGLVEYCTSDNAFQLGRMGISYMYVCPSTVEEEFLTGYRRGQNARQLEASEKKKRAQIEEPQDKVSN